MSDTPDARPGSSRARIVGVARAFVAVQFLLLGALFVVPRGRLWDVTSLLHSVANVALVLGFVLILGPAWQIRRAITAMPLPTQSAVLRTGGLYRLCRHPIYLGVLVVAASMTLTRAHVLAALLFVTLVVFFHVKARFEERQLRARFADYAAYASRTPAIVPLPRRRPRGS